jgi:hypothetical protein
MKNIRSTFVRLRLLNSVLLLVLMLVALSVTPVVRAEECGWVCSGWTAQSGCTTCNWCCAEAGKFTCTRVVNNDCDTGGPSKPLID